MAHAYAGARRAQILWTLGITEHRHAVDNVLALCNLALLTGHVGRYGSGLVPLRGQNNVQGGGDMGALPNKLPGFQDITDAAARGKFEALYGTSLTAEPGWHLTQMFEAMGRGDLRALYCIGENPAESEADVAHARGLLAGLETLIVQDVVMTRTAELASVVLPASAAWAESDGTVTSSERRVQRVRAAIPPPGQARADIDIIGDLARRLGAVRSYGASWGRPTAEELWDELRMLSPMHTGMSWPRLEAEGGLQWPCPTIDHPGTLFLHGWLWEDDLGGMDPVPFSVVDHQGPAEELSDLFPLRLTTGRALDSFNTGVQTGGYRLAHPLRRRARRQPGRRRAHRRRRRRPGQGHLGPGIRGDAGAVAARHPEGLTFTTFHFPDLVDTNVLTNDAWDPKSGTSEFKATAIRVEPLADGPADAAGAGTARAETVALPGGAGG